MPSTWSGTGNTGLITFNALRDAVDTGVFAAKVAFSSIPSGNEIVTKAEAESYLWVNESASPWSGYASNRCPPKSSFQKGQWCTLIVISDSDILSSTGNTLYPENTVYVVYNLNGSDYTESFTVADTYQRCCLPAINVSAAKSVYYYAYDVIQYFTNSSINFYPSPLANCDTWGCVTGAYSTLYNSASCPCSSGTSTTIYVNITPTWTVGTRVADAGGQNVAAGYYTYAGKCYKVELKTYDYYVDKAGTPQYIGSYQTSEITQVTNC